MPVDGEFGISASRASRPAKPQSEAPLPSQPRAVQHHQRSVIRLHPANDCNFSGSVTILTHQHGRSSTGCGRAKAPRCMEGLASGDGPCHTHSSQRDWGSGVVVWLLPFRASAVRKIVFADAPEEGAGGPPVRPSPIHTSYLNVHSRIVEPPTRSVLGFSISLVVAWTPRWSL